MTPKQIPRTWHLVEMWCPRCAKEAELVKRKRDRVKCPDCDVVLEEIQELRDGTTQRACIFGEAH